MATGLPYFNVVVDKFGNAIPNAQVAVLSGFGANTSTQPGSPLASIFSDVNLSQPISNPINTDAFGRFQFFAQTGNYLVQIYSALSPPLIAQYVVSVTLTGPSVLSVAGTVNQITVSNGLVNAVVGLANPCIMPGTLEVAGGSLKLDGATSGSTTLQVAAVAGTSNPLQLPTVTGSNGQVLSTNGANPQVLSWITPPGSVPIQVFSNKNLSGSVSVTGSTDTVIDSITVNAAGGAAPAFPSSGGPFRVLVRYQYFKNGGVDFSAVINDGTNDFAHMEAVTSNNNSCVQCEELSPVTYSGSGAITFTARIFDNGASTIVTTPAGMGSPTRTFNRGVSHMSVAVVPSN